MHKNKFIDWIVNKIQFEWNLTCVYKHKEYAIQQLNFQNSHPIKNIRGVFGEKPCTCSILGA